MMNCNDMKNVRLHNVKANEAQKAKEEKFYANWKLVEFISLDEAIDTARFERIKFAFCEEIKKVRRLQGILVEKGTFDESLASLSRKTLVHLIPTQQRIHFIGNCFYVRSKIIPIRVAATIN